MKMNKRFKTTITLTERERIFLNKLLKEYEDNAFMDIDREENNFIFNLIQKLR